MAQAPPATTIRALTMPVSILFSCEKGRFLRLPFGIRQDPGFLEQDYSSSSPSAFRGAGVVLFADAEAPPCPPPKPSTSSATWAQNARYWSVALVTPTLLVPAVIW